MSNVSSTASPTSISSQATTIVFAMRCNIDLQCFGPSLVDAGMINDHVRYILLLALLNCTDFWKQLTRGVSMLPSALYAALMP